MRSEAPVVPESVQGTLEELLAHDLSCAPHVVARLHAELDDDTATVLEVAARLDVSQRRGLRPLPSPLPLTHRIEAAFADRRLGARDHETLLAAALCLDGDLAPILVFDGRPAREFAASDAGAELVIRAGRVTFADPRLKIWIARTSPSATHARVHARLSEILAEAGDSVKAGWHRARASMHPDPQTAAELVRAAGELSQTGRLERALLLATEAAAHTSGAERDEALLVAAGAALGAGFAAEAATWLGGLFAGGAERHRLRGLGGLLVAQAHAHGSVPDMDPSAFRPSTDDLDEWRSWSRAAAFAALLSAERQDLRAMRTWLDALREGAAVTGDEHELRDPVVALTWLIAGEHDLDEVAGSGPLSGGMLRALRAAAEGDTRLGLRLLAVGDSAIGAATDPFVAGYESSPVVQAYRAVTEALLLTWQGEIATARDLLIRSSLRVPLVIPFAGLGVVLARRLDLAVLGEIGPFARSLTQALPSGLHLDHLVDRAIQAYLAGSFDEAAAYVRLWLDRGAPQPAFAVPALDEVALLAELRPARTRRLEPPAIALAQRLRVRAATATGARWRAERSDIRAAARTLESPFARARVEAMLGIRSVISGEVAAGRSHLRTASELFHEAGAAAWARAIEARLLRLDAEEDGTDPATDPLAACRHVWEQLLTARELEVAMLAVGGATNRDIAEALNLSVRTVEVHLGRAFAKLDVRSRVELTVLAHRTSQYL